MREYADRLTAGSAPVEEELEQEFETRLAESSNLAFRVAYSVLRQRQDAEDVAQEALLKAHRSFRQLRNRDAFRAWLVRMAWRLALDRQRADRRRSRWEQEHFQQPAAPTAPDPLIADEQAAHVWAAIDTLPEKLRLAIVLVNIEGHNLKDVGRLLGVAEGTIKARLFDARQRLKEQLQWTNNDQTR
jgi:RNA polymerase sigma-70 factor (ECF subfamily)